MDNMEVRSQQFYSATREVSPTAEQPNSGTSSDIKTIAPANNLCIGNESDKQQSLMHNKVEKLIRQGRKIKVNHTILN